MRALFLIPGDSSRQLQAFAAVAAVADQLDAEVQVVCAPTCTALWGLHPAGVRALPFPFGAATLADWANLLGSVREPDFQVCINRASGRQVDLMLAMSHIPTRVAAAGFSATDTVQPEASGWGAQAWQAFLRPIGVQLNADAFRLSLAKADLDAAAAELPGGDGPLLLLAPAGGAADWPANQWQALPERIRQRLPGLRTLTAGGGPARAQAARLASADVVLASDASCIELALMLGLPLVALGRSAAALPSREGVRGVGSPEQLADLDGDAVLQALGLG
ncbi:MAG: lipopolysaccharide heptosyltransferase family protein [Cyanobium sp. M30B3]|nr:MAG: lipopolysaccharide heptosyltransferase family protein [Cyanobium sp. M30B3]